MREKMDNNGVNVSLMVIVAFFLLALAVIGYLVQSTALWDYSWALVGVASFLLCVKLVSWNLWALVIIPVAAMALWVFGVMGGL